MNKETIKSEVYGIINCERMNNHQWKDAKCIKCGMLYIGHLSSIISIPYNYNTALTILAFYLMKRGINRLVDYIKNNLQKNNMTIEQEKAIRDFVSEITQNKKDDNAKLLQKIFGCTHTVMYDFVPPFKETVHEFPMTVKNRRWTKEWIDEWKEESLERCEPRVIEYRDIDFDAYLSLLEFKIKQGKYREALLISRMIRRDIYKLLKPRPIKKSLIPFLPAWLLLENFRYNKEFPIINFSSQILSLYSKMSYTYDHGDLHDILDVIKTILQIHKNCSIELKEYNYEDTDETIIVNI